MLRPLGDKVWVRPCESPDRLESGLFVPQTAQASSIEGEVVAVGPGRVLDNGQVVPVDLQPGDKVLFMGMGGYEVEKDGEKFLVFREAEILAQVG